MNIPPELLACLDPTKKEGYLTRIKHKTREDGSECTGVGKNAALVLSKHLDCWKFKCFRCGFSGVIPDGDMTPKETVEKILSRQQVEKKPITDTINVPLDVIRMTEFDYTNRNPDIPRAAINWFIKYNIPASILRTHVVGYSPFYRRVIFPLYASTMIDPKDLGKLMGWLGREVHCRTKLEREAKKIVKYLIRRRLSTKCLYYHVRPPKPGLSREPIVLTEDILSAFRIAYARNVHTFALLGTNLPKHLLLALKRNFVMLWLDGDMRKKMSDYCFKYRCLGWNITHVATEKDPKCYPNDFIRNVINSRMSGGRYYYGDI